MPAARASLKPVTVLFADIVASTALYVQRGDATAFALTAQCLGEVERHLVAGGGRIRKRLGDGLLATFESSTAALRAAQIARSALIDPDGTLVREGVRARFGITAGPAVDEADDIFGDVVNVAARLLALAGPDEIFLSGKVYEVLDQELRAGVRLIDQITLRNRPGAVLVYEYVGAEREATVSVAGKPRASTVALEIEHGARLFVIGPERPRLTIGRQASHDICVDHDAVSRTHAELQLREDRFVLVDRSTNGTYVHVDGGAVLRIVREELILAGAGRIVAGIEADPPIRFRVTAR